MENGLEDVASTGFLRGNEYGARSQRLREQEIFIDLIECAFCVEQAGYMM